MTTFIFFLAFLSSLLLTPVVRRIAYRLNVVDLPQDRKVHDKPIPRLGGVALFLAFFIALAILVMNKYMYHHLAADEPRLRLFLIGLTASFFLGLWDDIRRLSSRLKFLSQLLIALFSYYAGFQITIVSFPVIGIIHLGYFALPITLFWFLLVINAINLIDGLDGLAAGICLFASITIWCRRLVLLPLVEPCLVFSIIILILLPFSWAIAVVIFSVILLPHSAFLVQSKAR